MPTVIEKINKILYTPAEIELSPRLEEIIFKINLQSDGEFSKGAMFDEIAKELEKKGLKYPKHFLMNILQKLKRDFILQEVDGKWHSTML